MKPNEAKYLKLPVLIYFNGLRYFGFKNHLKLDAITYIFGPAFAHERKEQKLDLMRATGNISMLIYCLIITIKQEYIEVDIINQNWKLYISKELTSILSYLFHNVI